MTKNKILLIPKNKYGVTTPLRYPGGKSAISEFLSKIIESNTNITKYVEPYAGGAGVAISLLLNKKVKNIVINDFDPAVYCFWNSVVSQSYRLIQLIQKTPITLNEREKQKTIYKNLKYKTDKEKLKLGFAFLFLNRTNYSGILNAGVIGGEKQEKYKINARFNKEQIISKIETIRKYKKNIIVTRCDGIDVFNKFQRDGNALIYLDPPYVVQGKSLYFNSFKKQNHKNLANVVSISKNSNWIMTYDKNEFIFNCYSKNNIYEYQLNYYVQKPRKEFEYLITSSTLNSEVKKYIVRN